MKKPLESKRASLMSADLPPRADRSRNRRIAAEPVEPRTLFSAISFAPHVDFSEGGTSPIALVAADFNGDGNEDLAVADNVTDKVYVFFGSGAGSFTAGPVLSLSSAPTALVAGDFNGDGRSDLAVACTAAIGQNGVSVDVFLNTGAGTFGVGQITAVEAGTPAGDPVAFTAADFNRDGHLDLAVTDYTSESISILNGNGNGTFAAPITYQSDAHPTAVTAADFNNDGYPDLAVTSTITDNSTGTAVTSNQVSLIMDSSTGDFSAGPNIALNTGGIPTSIAAADLTTATFPGLVVGDSNGDATLLTNTTGSFSVGAPQPVAAGSTAIAAADFDLDGNTDLVSADGGSSTSTSTNSVTVIQGAGNGNVGNTSQFAVGAHPADVVVADFNNDGKPDIATANEVAGTLSILLNTTSVPLVSTRTTATISSASTPAGSTVTVTATITPSGVSPLEAEEIPTGTVDFYDGSTLLSSVILTSGSEQAVFSTTDLMIGSHTLRAKYLGDNGYATSTSAPTTETITPTATDGPDLVGTFVSSTLPAIVAPGESGTVTIRVTNQGNTVASGVITNSLDLSLDTLLDSGDTPLVVRGSLARTAVHLQPHQSVLLKGTVVIPQNTALASYYLLTSLNTTSSLAESVSTNNLAATPGTYAVQDVFGTVSGRKNVTLSVADNNGTTSVFRMSGPGEGSVNIGDDGVDLVLTGTTSATNITVTTAKGAIFDLTNLTAATAVGKISMPGVAVSSAVSLPDGVTSLSLNSFGSAGGTMSTPGGTMSIGGGTVAALSVGPVTNGTLATTGGIRSLTDSGWASGQITAPWIGTLNSKGNFTAGLTLSGVGAPGGVALNSASIIGTLGSATGTWTIAGTTNRLTTSAAAVGWTLNDAGVIKAISATSAFASTVNASTINSIKVTGPVTGATFNASSGILAINIRGTVDATTRFIAPVFPRKPVVGGAVVDPTTDPRFAS